MPRSRRGPGPRRSGAARRSPPGPPSTDLTGDIDQRERGGNAAHEVEQPGEMGGSLRGSRVHVLWKDTNAPIVFRRVWLQIRALPRWVYPHEISG